MRYSRFKAAMLGLEPQRRNRTNPNRSRVSKKKKDDGKSASSGSGTKPKDRAGDDGSDFKPEGGVKPEPRDTEPASSPQSRDIGFHDMVMTPKIKEERLFMPSASPSEHSYTQQLHLGGSPAPNSLSNLQHHIQQQQQQQQQSRLHMRLLTPCSDSDVLAGFGGGAAASPSTSDMLQHDAASFDFSPVPRLSPGPVVGADHDGAGHLSSWHHHHHAAAHPQNGYSAGFGMGMHGGYGAGLDGACYGAFCDHGDDHHQHQHQQALEDELGVHVALLEEGSQVMVKHEDWDTQSYH
ncbi:hypothetical protein B0H67DRAFT_372182 [Lasiosphaeris hirsuta]|uniref:Uncharacterized protein n=1 Tax=Lasiosphaeris hirsuta TaxID=260670 RepID=A0AA40DJ60_9PEZI|nr:hypothetical protein B0H67DRAFT_372182 [Lasiosphaeris hirsuta]